jgi:hypothetical protein
MTMTIISASSTLIMKTFFPIFSLNKIMIIHTPNNGRTFGKVLALRCLDETKRDPEIICNNLNTCNQLIWTRNTQKTKTQLS